ncbi:MAG: sigma-54 dependent transcriptional regulator [Candidatus Calescibacterium sp.]|nr:sigma-54 dependent transcriptional regulator [Candidatus Calescibacterium sp.]MCX7734686.1 sigma-54 dependent transcriptional regulator [bacterium]MDW8087578.1 sigma-54 dependent transcriptional regulator [Candidatus Calescibacterium sp.]
MGQLRQNIEGKTSILLIEDDRDVGESMRSVLSKHFWVDLYRTAEEALNFVEEKEYSVILCDLKLPGMSGLEFFKVLKERGFSKPFIIITAFGDIPTAVEATKLGVNDFIRKGSVSPDELIQKIYRVCEDSDSDFVCASPVMQNILGISKQVAKTDSNILIVGESGVGKEVLARYIHKVSPRANRPFVAINMSAIPDNLLESELFGYEKGAFTGAEKRKLGKFEIASGGTLLLDEIGDMPLHLQPKILRVIQERKIERLGYNYPIKVDVRIISTTNRDLESMVKEGKFREDLYFRLSVMPIKIPPLRERKEDIIPLVEHFVSRLSRKYEIDVSIGNGVIEKLMNYDWPGNVRELQNVLERAFVISFSSNQKKVVIEPNHLIVSPEDIWKIQIENKNIESKTTNATDIQKTVQETYSAKERTKKNIDFDDLNIRNMEKTFIIKALERTGGNKTQAAKLLGITVRTLRNKLKELKMENVDSETE